MNGVNFRAITFDGGGIRGLFQAMLFERLEEKYSIKGCLEAYAGTSTGAIVAAALTNGVSIEKISKLYQSLGKEVFSKETNLIQKAAFSKPSYDADILEAHLKDIFGNKLFGESTVRTLVCAVSLVDFSYKVFDSENQNDSRIPIVDVLMASTAAPFYFRAHEMSQNGAYYIDGGIACNDPSFETVKIFAKERISTENIKILSIGTGSHVTTNIPNQYKSCRIDKFIKNIIKAFSETSSSISCSNCEFVLKPENYIRIQPKLGKDIPLDAYDFTNQISANIVDSIMHSLDDAKMREWKKY